MKPNRLSSSEKMMLAKLREQVISARRWHHSEIARLDALWGGFPSEIARLSPQQRALRLEIAQRQIAKMISMVPPSVFEPEAGVGQAASPAGASEKVRDRLPA